TFNKADIHYENMVIRFDKNFQFQGFEVLKDTRIDNAQVNLSLGRKPEKVNIGELHWRAEAEADSKGFRVKDGDIEFSLNQNIRDYIDRTVTQQLSDAGLKDVDLEVSPSGEISIKNATYEVRAKGRSGNNGTEIDIPLLSRLFKKPKKVMNISAKLDITPRIENNCWPRLSTWQLMAKTKSQTKWPPNCGPKTSNLSAKMANHFFAWISTICSKSKWIPIST
ncbi:MAG: hypothetical protein FD128_2858, partial [Hyphomonadaceae bacterium]